MKAHRNGSPETCAANLLRIVRGEVPYDRVRGVDGTLLGQTHESEAAAADAEWLLETYEPRVSIGSIEVVAESTGSGDFFTDTNIERKDDDE